MMRWDYRCFVTLLAGLACSVAANAQLGYDTSFATNGKYVSGLSGDDIAKAMTLHQGKVYVAGVCPSISRPPLLPAKPACVLRLLANGQPDPSFNGGIVANTSGRVSFVVGDTDTDVYDVAVSPDGKVTVSGRCTASNVVSACLLRLNSNGSVDGSFGNAGRAFLSNESGFAELPLLAEPDGSILIGSTSQFSDPFVGLSRAMLLRRVSTTGVTSGFGSTFKPGNSLSPRQLLKQADGKVLAAGECVGIFVPDPRTFCSARFLATGALDTSYGDSVPSPDGITWIRTTSLGATVAQVIRAALTTDQTLVMAGQCGTSPYAYCAVGVPSSNPANTWYKASVPGLGQHAPLERSLGLAATIDNKVVFIASSSSAAEVLTSRFTAGGFADQSLNGFLTIIDIQTGLSNAGIIIQPDRKVVMAGKEGAANDFVVGRLHHFAGGRLDMCTADVDGDGAHTATVDALLWSRVMLGLTGTAVTDSLTFPAGATRTTWSSIRDYLVSTCGMSLAP